MSICIRKPKHRLYVLEDIVGLSLWHLETMGWPATSDSSKRSRVVAWELIGPGARGRGQADSHGGRNMWRQCPACTHNKHWWVNPSSLSVVTDAQTSVTLMAQMRSRMSSDLHRQCQRFETPKREFQIAGTMRLCVRGRPFVRRSVETRICGNASTMACIRADKRIRNLLALTVTACGSRQKVRSRPFGRQVAYHA